MTARRAVQGLDAPLSDAELRRIAEERQARRGRRSITMPLPSVPSPPTDKLPRENPNGTAWAPPERIVIGAASAPIATRYHDRLTLVLLFAPRTKKNSKEHYARQSLGYRKFRNAVVAHIASIAGELRLPLPDLPYNIAATFYTDNERCDTVGLMQGLADALENAGVITNDCQLRTWNGTEQRFDADHPRVELALTPIANV